MDDVLQFVLGSVCVLTGVTMVGHGIWVLLAAVARSLSGEAESASLSNSKPCPECGARFGVARGRCTNCGAVPRSSPQSTLREELLATARQLKRLETNGSITREQYDALATVLSKDLSELNRPMRPTNTAAPQASETEEIVAAEVVEDQAPVGPPGMAAGRAAALRAGTTSPAASPEDEFVVVRSNVQPAHAPAAAATLVSPAGHESPFGAPPRSSTPAALLPAVPAPPTPPPPKLSDMLQGFLEESNIRWGEILAGFFIVVSSIGLVISLQSTLEKIPYFPALLFTGFTLAFHGAGLYTLKRWNLHAISRVVLVISLLLVPLTASAAVLMSSRGGDESTTTSPALFWIVLAIGTISLTWVAYTASRELVSIARWPLTIAVVGCSLAEVLVHRLGIRNIDFWSLSAFAAIPLGCFLTAIVYQLGLGRRWKQTSWRRSQQMLIVLGAALFAFIAAMAMILVKAEPRGLAAARLAPEFSLAAGGVMALGLLLHRRTTARNLAGVRLTGTVILLLGGLAMVLMVVLAWPEPELLFAVGVVNAILLVALALGADLALLLAPAIACAALASLIGFHLAQGRFLDVPPPHLGAKVIEAALMGRSSVVMLTLALASAGAAGGLRWIKRLEDARIMLASGGALVGIGVLIALFAGFIPITGWSQDQHLAAPLLLFYATALLVATPLTPWPYVASAGSIVLFAALLQAFRFNAAVRDALERWNALPAKPVLAALVGHALMSGLALLLWMRRELLAATNELLSSDRSTFRQNLVEPVAGGAAISLVAAVPVLFFGRASELQQSAVAASLAGLAWLIVALATRWKPAVSGMQVMLLLAPALAVAHYCQAQLGREWYRSLDHVALQCAALAIGTIPWSAMRRLFPREADAGKLLRTPWPGVDEFALGIATVSAALIAWVVAIPGMAWELGYDALAPLLLADDRSGLLTPLAWTMAIAGATSLGLCASLLQRVRLLPLVGLAIGTLAVTAGAALPWHDETALASAIRWWSAGYAVVWGGLFIARGPIRRLAKSFTFLRWGEIDSQAAHLTFGAVPLVLGALPVLVLTVLAVAQNVAGVDLRGPAVDSIFSRIGPTASYAIPLLAIVGVLIGYALREREISFALAASAIFQFAINLAFLLYVTLAASAPSEVRAAEWLQWNGVAAGGFALVWLAMLRWMLPKEARITDAAVVHRAGTMLGLQVFVAGIATAALVGWAGFSVIARPQSPTPEREVLGGILSYLSIALACVATGWLATLLQARWRLGLSNVGFVLLGGGVALAAATVDRFDLARDWLAYHTLIGGWLALLGLAAIANCLLPKPQPAYGTAHFAALVPAHGLIAALGFLLVLLAARGNFADPGQPWWSLAACGGVAATMTAIGLRRGSQPYAYGSIAVTATTILLLLASPALAAWRASLGAEREGVLIELLTFTLLGIAALWQAAEIFSQRRRSRSLDATFFGPRSHEATLLGWLPLYAAWRLASALFGNEPGDLVSYAEISGSTVVVAWGIVRFAALWDRRAILALPALLAWLAVVALLIVDLTGPQIPRFFDRVAILTLSTGLLLAVAGQAWSYGANLSVIGSRLGVSDPVAGLKRTELWLPALALLVAAVTSLAALGFVLTLPRHDVRLAVAFAPAAAAWGLACLADDERRPQLRLLSLLVAGLSAVYLAWAQLGVDMSAAMWLTRSFRLLMVLSVLTFIYGLALPRWLLTGGTWNGATRKAGYVSGVAAIAAFLGVLILEVVHFQPGIGAPVDYPQVLAIAAVLVVLMAGLISMALLKGRDPLLLSEKGRQAYVYAALATAALLFAHLYVCRPMWFDAGLLPYWPLIVMGIAFVGAGGGELFARYRIHVLAEPLLRVSSMLPLLPVLGMWIVAPKETDYALVLLVVGLLYLMLSVTRRSWASLLAAAMAGNGALWSLLHRTGFELLANPQLWLIPPALSVLLAAHVNRRRLPTTALTSIRYACMLLIYVSSTSEIFLRGVATSLWPAMILASLSVAGALLGMMLRIRAFLYLGVSFALVSLITMVAHAAQAIDHVWPWWAFGVGMGIAILVLFGIFEKQKTEILRLIARLREWEQ